VAAGISVRKVRLILRSVRSGDRRLSPSLGSAVLLNLTISLDVVQYLYGVQSSRGEQDRDG
jgi:hypothetical protein